MHTKRRVLHSWEMCKSYVIPFRDVHDSFRIIYVGRSMYVPGEIQFQFPQYVRALEQIVTNITKFALISIAPIPKECYDGDGEKLHLKYSL